MGYRTKESAGIGWLVLCLLLLTLATRLSFGASNVTAQVLLEAPVHYSDAKAHWADLAYWRHEVARAINAATPDPAVRAALVRIAIEESNLALFVIEGRCKDGPKGACDDGRAKGPWQLQRSFDTPVVPDDLEGQAKLAAQRWRGAMGRCHEYGKAGAFMGYGTGGRCEPAQWAKDRGARLQQIEGLFR